MGYSPWGCKDLDLTEQQSSRAHACPPHTHTCTHTHTHTHLSNSSSRSIIIILCLSPKSQFHRVVKRGQMTPPPSIGHITGEEPGLGKPQAFIVGCTQTCSLCLGKPSSFSLWTADKPALSSGGRHHLCLPRLFSVQTSLKR